MGHHTWCQSSLISKANSARILLGILSGPDAVCVFTRETSFHICDLVTVGGGEAAGRKDGSLSVSSAGSEQQMLLKWVLIMVVICFPSRSWQPGRCIRLFFGRMPLLCLAVAYQKRVFWSAWQSFCSTKRLFGLHNGSLDRRFCSASKGCDLSVMEGTLSLDDDMLGFGGRLWFIC